MALSLRNGGEYEKHRPMGGAGYSRDEEIKRLWDAIHALEEKIDKPMCGPGIEDKDDA